MAKGDYKIKRRERRIDVPDGDGTRKEVIVEVHRIAIVGRDEGVGEHEHPFDGATPMPDGERFLRWARE